MLRQLRSPIPGIFVILISLVFVNTLYGQEYSSIISKANSISDGQEKISYLKSRSSEISEVDSLAILYLDIANNYFDFVISIDSSIFYCDEALRIIGGEYHPHQNIYAEAHYLKGFFYRKWDKYELSLSALEKVIDSGNKKYLFPAKVQLGKLYKDRGEFNIAFEQYDDALKIAGNDWSKRIRVYEYISFAYSVMGTDEGARNSIIWLDSLEAGLQILNDPSYEDYYELVNFNKGSSYFELGQLDKAKYYINKAEGLLVNGNEDPDFMGLIIEMQGAIAMQEGDFKTGIEKIKAGIDLFQYSFDLTRSEGLAGTYSQIADAYLKWGKPDSALVYNEKAIYDRVYGLNNEQNDPDKTFEQMLFANGEKNYLIYDYRQKGEIFEVLAQTNGEYYLDSALACYLLAEDILDAMSTFHFDYDTKAFWRQNAKDLYQEIIRLSYRLGDKWNAFIYSEKSKYVILEEHLKKSNIDAYATDISLIKEYQHTLDVISALEEKYHNRKLSGNSTDYYRQQILEFRQEEEDQLLRIREEYPDIFNNIYSWQKPDIKKLTETLAADNAEFFSYFIHDSTSYLFHIMDEDLTITPLPPQKEIESLVLEFRDFILENKSGSADIYNQLASELYHLLLPTHMDSNTRELVIVPDGILSILPFSILTDSTDTSHSYREINYLFRSYVINMQLNAKAYLTNNENSVVKEYGRGIAIAPTFNNNNATVQVKDTIRSGLNNLKGAAEEIKYVNQSTGAKIFTKGFGEKTFYEKLKTNPSIIHLSTHALINETQPEWSKLIMSKTSDTLNDDFIHLFELKNKTIHSDLVVLSACDTRTGKYLKGEGVSSLGIALNYAGSPNTVNTLWPIQDETSVNVMRNFYANLKNDVPKNESLQQAKIAYLQSQPEFLTHPYYWAGYVYYGNNRPLVEANITLMKSWLPITLILVVSAFFIVYIMKYKSYI